jgi:hypothetical protein
MLELIVLFELKLLSIFVCFLSHQSSTSSGPHIFLIYPANNHR